MKLSIRYKILLGFLLVMLLSLAAEIITLRTSDKNSEAQTLEILEDKSRNASSQIQNFITRIEVEHLGISHLYLESGGDLAFFRNYTKHMFRQKPFINKLSIISTAGRELFKTDKFGETDESNLSFEIISMPFERALNGNTGISKVYYSDTNSLPFMDVYTPIITEKGETVGIVKSQIQLNNLWDLIAEIKIGSEGYSYVVDDEGRLIAHPVSELVMKAPNYSTRGIVSALILNKPTESRDHYYINEKGANVVADGIKTQTLDWIVITEQPVSEAFQSRYLLRNLFLTAMSGSVLLLIFISFFLSNQLTRPLRTLQKFVNQYHHNRSKKLEIKSGDEIEALASSFNNMIDNLNNAFNQLEIDKEVVEGERNKISIVLEGINDGVIAVDLHRNVVIFNPAARKITNLKTKDVLGKPIEEVIRLFDEDKELSPNVYCPIKRDTYEGMVFTKNNLKMESMKGKVSYVNLITGQIKEAKATNLGSIITFHDVTDERELERMKLDFVSMAAHELRTPLTTIQGYLSFLKDPQTLEKLNEDEKKFLDRAAVSSLRLTQLIENLLVVSSIEKGTMSINLQRSNLSDVIEKIINDFLPLAEVKGIEFKYIPPEEKIDDVLVDPLRIDEVINNLVGNAINYTQKGSVTVRTYQAVSDIIFSVEDTGPGIPPDAIPHLFTKFFRIQGKLESGSKGTGLGLYISRNIIEAHKGKIWVDSTLGKGSVFYFSLPAVKGTPATDSGALPKV